VTPFDLITLALFTWLVAHMLIKTDGPFHVFARLRSVTTFGGLLACIVCLSPWVAGLGYVVLQSPFAALVQIMAAAALGLWGARYVGWDYQNG
jgi:hypothetical protein